MKGLGIPSIQGPRSPPQLSGPPCDWLIQITWVVCSIEGTPLISKSCDLFKPIRSPITWADPRTPHRRGPPDPLMGGEPLCLCMHLLGLGALLSWGVPSHEGIWGPPPMRGPLLPWCLIQRGRKGSSPLRVPLSRAHPQLLWYLIEKGREGSALVRGHPFLPLCMRYKGSRCPLIGGDP